METIVPILVACIIGFAHAFEADHLVAVGNIVSKRNNTLLALKDGIFWGLGHTSTILIIGVLMIIGKVMISEHTFHYFEAGVGVMLVLLGFFRLAKLWKIKNGHSHAHLHDESGRHGLAYGVGAIHGLAGGGSAVILVMAQAKTMTLSISYLLLFGLGSVVGMLVAAGIFSLPFSKRITANVRLQITLIIASSLLCIGYGALVIYESLSS